jgi:signal peptidase I
MKKYVGIMFIALLIIGSFLYFIIKQYWLSVVEMTGRSMNNTYQDGDFLLVSKIKTLDRDDIVMYQITWKRIPYVGRVIWLPNEVVKINNWNVYICDTNDNCNEKIEPFVWAEWTLTNNCNINSFVVWTGYFVMWDNRNYATDSRCCFGVDCNGDKRFEVYFEEITTKVIGTIKYTWIAKLIMFYHNM